MQLDSIEQHKRSKNPDADFSSENGLSGKPVIALLSGSRRHEISRLLPEMVSASKKFPGYEFVVAGAPSVPDSFYSQYIEGAGICIVHGKTYELLENSTAAVVTSGTATLETALFRVPQVVVFKTGGFTYFLGSLFVSIRFFSLVNLIAGKEIVKELLQFNLSRDIVSELDQILNNPVRRSEILAGYESVAELLGGAGTSERIATRICELAKKS